jgi:Ni,Fe-hydrogenase I cytochrome b subunit
MRLPRWITGLAVAALLAVGLFVSGPFGGLALVPVAVLLAWLTYLSWPALGAGARLVRLAGVLVVVAYTGVRLSGG